MLDHLGLQAADVDAAAALYTTVFAPIGLHEVARFPAFGGVVVGMAGDDGFPRFWLSPRVGEGTDETHVAFTAPDRAGVDRVHEAALAAGVEVLHAPREWPEYHPGYYGVFLRDLDGNNVEAVCHRPEG